MKIKGVELITGLIGVSIGIFILLIMFYLLWPHLADVILGVSIGIFILLIMFYLLWPHLADVYSIKENRLLTEATTQPIHTPLDLRVKILVATRIVQAFFIGLFFLGLSLIGGDFIAAAGLPTASLSVATTIYGVLGAVASEILARRVQKWTMPK